LQVKALRPLFQMNLLDEAAPLSDISADGKRFLMVTLLLNSVNAPRLERDGVTRPLRQISKAGPGTP
jgi:hypothetical protein